MSTSETLNKSREQLKTGFSLEAQSQLNMLRWWLWREFWKISQCRKSDDGHFEIMKTFFETKNQRVESKSF